ncbi:MAG TPA: zf-HC2 domain-containing protein [Ktedonobacterales bacterium]|nr:zf-HC2 domain-containing protein [Ktedonobacterales bacterium]
MAERELTCQELVELITAYLENALPTEEQQRFERHLTYCPGCRAYMDQMRVTLRLLGTLSAEDIPGAMQQELLAAFRGLRAHHERH